MKKLVFVFVCLALSAKSQNCRYMTKVVDSKGMPLDGSYILLDTTASYIEGGLFENGSLCLNLSLELPIKLVLMSKGYESITLSIDSIEIKETKKEHVLRTLSRQLKQVNIKHEKPVFEKTLEGTKIHIENSILSRSANSAELLAKIPTLSISAGKLNVFGRGEAILILNGKETSIDNIKSLPVNDIKTIEVITNPDARYDAKGKAVVLIHLKNYIYQGYSFNFSNNTTFGIVPEHSFGKYIMMAPNTSLKLRWKKLEFDSYFGTEYGKNWSENVFLTTAQSIEGLYKKRGYYTEDNFNKGVYFYRAGLGYKFSPKSLVTLEYDGLSHLFLLDVKQNGDYFLEDKSLSEIRMTNNASTKLVNHSWNLNYFQKLDTNGSNLFIGSQYNSFRNNLLDQITERITEYSKLRVQNRINDGLNQINLYAAQVDYSHKSKNSQWDLGFKYSTNTNEGKIQFYAKSESDLNFIENLMMANSTHFNEQIIAGYGLYKSKWNGISYSFGMRWENTHARNVSRRYQTTLMDTNYSNFFPSMKINFQLFSKYKFALSYAYKIQRPIYQDLDPFLWYLDSLTSIQGNASLRPEYLHQIEIRWLHDKFVLRYGYALSNNAIMQVMKQGSSSDNAVIFTKDNIEKKIKHTWALEIPLELGNYSSYQTIALNIAQISDSRPKYQALMNSPQLYIYTYHAFKIPKWFTLELTGEYYSRSFDGFTERKPYYYFSIGLSKSFLKNEQLNCSILWNDFSRSALWSGVFAVNTFSNEYNQRFTNDYLRLSINYSFANRTAFAYKNQRINQSEYDRIKK